METNVNNNTNNNTKKAYASSYITSVEKEDGSTMPYAIIEGFLARDMKFSEATGDKPSMLMGSVGIGPTAIQLLSKEDQARLAGDADLKTSFISLFIFRQDAERLNNLSTEGKFGKGSKVLIAGRPSLYSYKNKDGKEVNAVRIAADYVRRLSSRAGEGDPISSFVPSFKTVYEDNGENRTQYLGLVSGTVKSVGKLSQTNSGKSVLNVDLGTELSAQETEARINHKYQKDANYGSTKGIRLSIWGKSAEGLSRGKTLTVGNKLIALVSALANTGNDGNRYVNFSTRQLSVLSWATPAENAAGTAAAAENTAESAVTNTAPVAPPSDIGADMPDYSALMDDEDMDLPF